MKTIPKIWAIGLGFMAFASFGTARAGDTVQSDESKEKKAVIEQPEEKWWNFEADAGYKSKYIFRGNDLTHDSDGIAFENIRFAARVENVGDFSVGLYAIQMLGEGHTTGSFLVQQTGSLPPAGYVTTPSFPAPSVRLRLRDDFETTIERFNEYDVYAQGSRSFGPVKVTIGAILFLVDSRTTTTGELIDLAQPKAGGFAFASGRDVSPAFVLRPYIALSADKIPYVMPSLRYYENVVRYEGGDGSVPVGAGYMEGQLDGKIPSLFERGSFSISANPYAVVSVSFRDRSHLGIVHDTNKNPAPGYTRFFDDQADTFYTGFQHFQTGFELPVQFNKYVAFVPSVDYVHLFSLIPGDRRDTYIAGAKVRLTF